MGKEMIPWLIVIIPFFGFLINIFIGRFLPKVLVNIVACGSILVSFVLSVYVFSIVSTEKHGFASVALEWFTIPGIGKITDLRVNLELWVDQLTSVMILVITGVGFLIHVYSTGYMSHDPRYHRYFSFLNLFSGFMLLLVLAKNLLLMFVGWEGVGLCSYLLIGFWFDDKVKGIANSSAGMKAFIVNRIGDLGFSIGMLILLTYVGSRGHWTLDIQGIEKQIKGESHNAHNDHTHTNDPHKKEDKHHEPQHDIGLLTLASILLFVGACGKSAQIPLYVWLPDAMAGPTPVSALIHAATMVTAGVYMVCRLGFLFAMCPIAMNVVAFIGVGTALFAATIGICQNDIKKVLAYSTISQLGFMFLAAGVGAYTAAIFHLMTHAFFKACLFLGSGSVIHGTEDQDIRNMGGLRSKMPVTFLTFAIATAAICGIPPLAGFWSKDEILLKAFEFKGTGMILWILGSLAAFCTAFYMSRLLFLTFFGKYRVHHHVHESPKSMTIPLILLAALSLIGGLIGTPWANMFESYLEPVFHGHAEHPSQGLILGLMGLAVTVSAVGIFLAYNFYIKKPETPALLSAKIKGLYNLVSNKYYVDEAYEAAVIKPVLKLNNSLANFDYDVVDGAVNLSGDITAASSHGTGVFDNDVIDGGINVTGESVGIAGQKIRAIQNGNVKSYITFAVTGGLVIILLFCCYYLLKDSIYNWFRNL